MAGFGADAALPDVLMALASCAQRADFTRPRGARFTDLRALSERPSLYPEAEAQAKKLVCEPEPIPH